jgi:hypothetical protein
MGNFWRLVVRVVFWSYDRGSLPYDLLVMAILLFVLVTPRKWYHDQPRVSATAAPDQVQLLDRDPATDTLLYRVDAGLLLSPNNPPELQQQLHTVLSQDVQTLRNQTFQIVQIQPLHDGGSVVGYEIRVKPSH